MEIKSILTPIIRREIPDLLRWISFCPAPFREQRDTKGIEWHISIDDEWKEEEMEEILSYAQHSHLRSFAIKFHSLQIIAKESVYLRNIPRTSSVDLPYGSKSGPNKQFFESIKRIVNDGKQSKENALILLEVDAIPIRMGWLTGLDEAIRNKGTFLIAGSRYQGKSKISSRINKHLNGNAIYGIGCADFEDFIQGWDSLLRSVVKICHWIAYDICFEWVINSNEIHAREIAINHSKVIELYKKTSIDISGFIANISGADEVSNDNIPTEAINEQIMVVHSKPFSKKTDYLLAGVTLDLSMLKWQNPLNLKLKALKQGPYAYFSSPNASKLSIETAVKLIKSEIFIKDRLVCSIVKSCIRRPNLTAAGK